MPQHARNRLVPVLLLVLATAGCAGSTSGARPVPSTLASAGPRSAAPATSNALPGGSVTADPKATEAAFTGAAADKFGAANVAAAYNMVIQMNRDGYTNDVLLGLKQPRVLDFSYLDHYFTQAVLDGLHPAEAAVAAGKPTDDQVRNVLGAAVWDIVDTDKGLALSNPATRNFVYTGAKTSVDKNRKNQPLLVLDMSFGVQYLGTLNGKAVYYQINRPETVRLIQTGDKDQPWKVDSYVGQIKSQGPLPDNG